MTSNSLFLENNHFLPCSASKNAHNCITEPTICFGSRNSIASKRHTDDCAAFEYANKSSAPDKIGTKSTENGFSVWPVRANGKFGHRLDDDLSSLPDSAGIVHWSSRVLGCAAVVGPSWCCESDVWRAWSKQLRMGIANRLNIKSNKPFRTNLIT